MRELADRLFKVSSEYFIVGSTLYFDPVCRFSLGCVNQAKHEPYIYGNNTPTAVEARLKARLDECKDKLQRLFTPIFEYRNRVQYFGPEGFNPQFVQEMYEKVLTADWTKVEAADGIEKKLKELNETAVLSR